MKSVTDERRFILHAPLLITEVGTHNTDFMLMKRAMQQRDSPSLVVSYARGPELFDDPTWCVNPSPPPPHAERALQQRSESGRANSCGGCLFWRGVCLRGAWHAPLEHEITACDFPPQGQPGCR